MVQGVKVGARSLTFVPALVSDNPELLRVNPEYMAFLRGLPMYERRLLLDGNWKTRREGGMRYKRDWFGEPAEPPPLSEFVRIVRYWDRASTEVSDRNGDPDWSASTKLGEHKNGMLWVLDANRTRATPGNVRNFIARAARHDGLQTELWLEQDPGQAGVAERMDLANALREFGPKFVQPSGSKWERSGPFSAAAEHGRVRIARGSWNEDWLSEHEQFVDEKLVKAPPGYHDDWPDSSSGSFNTLVRRAEPRIY